MGLLKNFCVLNNGWRVDVGICRVGRVWFPLCFTLGDRRWYMCLNFDRSLLGELCFQIQVSNKGREFLQNLPKMLT